MSRPEEDSKYLITMFKTRRTVKLHNYGVRSSFLNFYYIYYIVCMGVRLIVFQKDQTDQARFISNSSSQNLTYNFYINLACLSWWVFGCLFVCFYVSNNVKTAKPIGPKFCVGHHVTPGKVYDWSNLKNLC